MRVTDKYRSPIGPSTDAASAPADSAPSHELCLLLPRPNPAAVFSGNLADHLFGRVVPRLTTTSTPDLDFWHDIDLCTPFPRRGLFDSVFAHAALLGLLYAVSIWPQSTSHLSNPLSRRALEGYTLSGYLPELHSLPAPPRASGAADPVQAKQEILSLPEAPDNLRQTIVTPPQLQLKNEIDLPNMVAGMAAPAPPLQPLAASQRDSTSLRFPRFVPEVIGPSADTNSLTSLQPHSKLPAFEMRVVEPVPDVAQANPRLALPAFQPKVVEPAPDLGHINLGHGSQSTFAHLAPPIAAPVPEPPLLGDVTRPSGQIIALSLHPSPFQEPLKLPVGNRRGAFASSLNGRPEATGVPGKDSSMGAGATRSNAPVNAPAGINVTAAPSHVIATAVAAPNAPSPNAPSPNAAPSGPNLRAQFMAVMHSPATSIPPRQPIAREASGARSELENRIFAGRRSYTLSVNMPNLNAATGSWIIHFVEREPGVARSTVSAPEVVNKSDPAYPGELMHDGVEGTVVLRAIIRADGSVGDIAVVKSLDSRLDRNAAQALSRWLFRPALKNGQAIDLEAVITVPFRVHAARF